MAENSSMISRSVPAVPKDDVELRQYIEKILENHYQDIHTLFSMTTDCDRYEKLQRENRVI